MFDGRPGEAHARSVEAHEVPTTVADPMARHGAPSAPGLLDEARFFFQQTNPRLIAPLLGVALVARLLAGSWSRWDFAVVAAQIAIQPFVEWLIHVYILHWKPRKFLGRTLDPYVSRKHREHHRDPRDVKWIFIPRPVVFRLIPGMAVLYFLVFRTLDLGLTALAGGLAILLTYEWTHYLIHSRYQPRTALYRYIWRAHRLHHYKNENYWFGVTMHLGDHVLRTFPNKDEVETSPTCRTLGIEASAL